jgi:hypothetical protein
MCCRPLAWGSMLVLALEIENIQDGHWGNDTVESRSWRIKRKLQLQMAVFRDVGRERSMIKILGNFGHVVWAPACFATPESSSSGLKKIGPQHLWIRRPASINIPDLAFIRFLRRVDFDTSILSSHGGEWSKI